MKHYYTLRISLLIILSFIASLGTTYATHLYGGEMYYTHITGSRYKVTMVLYGDCSASSSVFNALYTARPVVQVYNGTTLFRTMLLNVEAGAGTEVTPVCPLSLDSTTCKGGSIPGVRRFSYSDTVSLSASSSWRFRSTGSLGSTSSGRSSTISNILSPGSSIMSMEATLNNSTRQNSNPTFTTIPTPFFCINVNQEYNIGAVDSNTTDSLVYSLVDGLDASTTPSSTVTYRTGYSASAPLACATGTFTFSTSTGQLTFKPNLAQVSLVVYRVTEYNGTTIIGTIMREMNFIVLSTCSNRSPMGSISSAVGGTTSGSTVVNSCKNDSLLTFNINPVDSDGNNINVSIAGLPAGATMTVSGNNTTSPSCAFSWNTSSVAPGTYYFYVTYQDNACPLSSKQTVVYSINILPKPSFSINTISLATCTQKAVFDVIPSGTGSPWLLKIFQGTSLVKTHTGLTGTKRDSLDVGTYTFNLTNANGCFTNINFSINPPPSINIQSATVVRPKCYASNDGGINILASGGLSPFQYRINSGSFGSSGLFGALSAGTYTIQIRDANNCIKDTIITIANPDSISLKAFVKKNLCNGTKNGKITIEVIGGTGAFLFEKNSSGILQSSRTFDSLAVGSYLFKAIDSNNCSKTITAVVSDSLRLKTGIATVNVSCFGGNDGVISLSPSIGFSPYTFSISAGPFVPSGIFTSLPASVYTLKIKDSMGCFLDTLASISQPKKLGIKLVLQQPSCNAYSDGIITAIGIDGTAPYTFSIDAKPHSSASLFSGLISKKYSFQVKDAKGCIYDTVITLDQPEPLFITLKAQSPLCNGAATGTILVTANGGTPSYQYAYDASPLQSSPLLENIKAGSYLVKVVDAKGCIKDSSIVITEPTKLMVDKVAIVNPTCENYPDGSILLSALGGIKPYTYALNSINFSTLNFFEKLREAKYVVSVKDSNNCTVDSLISLIGYPKIKLDSTLINPTKCFGTNEGMIELFASGGNPPLRYTFENSTDTTRNALYKNLVSKNYFITVLDTTKCFKTFQVTVPQPQLLKANTSVVHNDCTGIDTNGRITALIEGGTEPYSYRWSFNNSSAVQIGGLSNGLYSLWVKDINGCADSLTSEVYYDNCCTPSIPNIFTPNNDGNNDVFRVLYKGDVMIKEFSIYNRYGQRVFSTNNLNQGWDGTFNGQAEEMGVYYYMLRMVCGNLKNKEIFLKGDITLLR